MHASGTNFTSTCTFCPGYSARWYGLLLPHLLVGQDQILPVMLLRQPTDLSYLFRCVRSRRTVRTSALLHQALPCPVVSLQPLVQRLPADLVPYRCLRRILVLQKMLQIPLTCVCFLCYPVHAESPPVIAVGVVTLFYHLALCFVSPFVTHLLYQNKISRSSERKK